MTNFSTYKMPVPSTITTMSDYSVGAILSSLTGANITSSSTTSTANRPVYIPFTLDQTTIVRSLFMANGSTVAGSMDLGIYDFSGTRIVSTGSTVQTGANTVQVVSITATTLAPGAYYLAWASNSTSSSFAAVLGSVSIEVAMVGSFVQLATFPLPATATFATHNSSFLPIIGLATVSIV